ncbi:helix-turn-helix domain-containing protein [Xylella fastidiosa subsp. multiplex]|uniref:helix-turn-helix domain-containing protein n=1 Tax=Xylella fastidiosa TaxID=2371 RepID=UPI00234D17B7|nr:helix-turn-helix transcriptional regulator [Xylella fastidiosa]MDC6416651.1 helix-turn-helix domain-containing protein [Xylella fastidiosa subsp. multiplex]
METIGSRVRKEREAQNINRSDFAKKTGIGYSTMLNWNVVECKRLQSFDLLLMRWRFLRWLETGKGEKIEATTATKSIATEKYRNIISALNIRCGGRYG